MTGISGGSYASTVTKELDQLKRSEFQMTLDLKRDGKYTAFVSKFGFFATATEETPLKAIKKARLEWNKINDKIQQNLN